MKWGLWNGKLVCPIVLMLFFVLLAFPGTGLADGGGESGELEQIVNGYQVHLGLDQPAQVGEMAALVKLSDSQGQPVKAVVVQITVQLSASADDHSEVAANEHDGGHTDAADSGHTDPGSHASEAGSHADSAELAEHSHGASFDLHPTETMGEYTGTLAFEDSGQWMVTVLFLVDGKIHQAHFPIDVVQIDSTPTVLTAFLGVNVAILSAAVILKRKSAGPKAA